jgi:hypothetical protein
LCIKERRPKRPNKGWRRDSSRGLLWDSIEMTQNGLESETWIGQDISAILIRQSEVDPVGREEYLGVRGM